MNRFLDKIAAWLTEGYPEEVPGPDRVPLLALLSRRLTTDEVKQVATALQEQGSFGDTDIGVAITHITNDVPKLEDIERVRERLVAHGWPFDDDRDSGVAR